MTIQQRIRKTAASKIKVCITSRTRSKSGFTVATPREVVDCRTKAEALQVLLAKVRCFDEQLFVIGVRRPFKKGG